MLAQSIYSFFFPIAGAIEKNGLASQSRVNYYTLKNHDITLKSNYHSLRIISRLQYGMSTISQVNPPSTLGYCFSSQEGPLYMGLHGNLGLECDVNRAGDPKLEWQKQRNLILSVIVIFSKKREKIRLWGRGLSQLTPADILGIRNIRISTKLTVYHFQPRGEI